MAGGREGRRETGKEGGMIPKAQEEIGTESEFPGRIG